MQAHTVIHVLPGGTACFGNEYVEVHAQAPSLMSKVFDSIKNVSATIMANATLDNAARAGVAVAGACLTAYLVQSMSDDSGHEQQHRYVHMRAGHCGPNQDHVEALAKAYAKGFLDCLVQTMRGDAIAGHSAIAHVEKDAPSNPSGRLLT
jgi:hypothetical protein